MLLYSSYNFSMLYIQLKKYDRAGEHSLATIGYKQSEQPEIRSQQPEFRSPEFRSNQNLGVLLLEQ